MEMTINAYSHHIYVGLAAGISDRERWNCGIIAASRSADDRCYVDGGSSNAKRGDALIHNLAGKNGTAVATTGNHATWTVERGMKFADDSSSSRERIMRRVYTVIMRLTQHDNERTWPKVSTRSADIWCLVLLPRHFSLVAVIRFITVTFRYSFYTFLTEPSPAKVWKLERNVWTNKATHVACKWLNNYQSYFWIRLDITSSTECLSQYCNTWFTELILTWRAPSQLRQLQLRVSTYRQQSLLGCCIAGLE